MLLYMFFMQENDLSQVMEAANKELGSKQLMEYTDNHMLSPVYEVIFSFM